MTRGVAPENEERYQHSTFTCDDGTIIPADRVNDNFCDCTNGEDEPGTSACSILTMHNKTFHCPNAGHRPKLLFRSQVDDGICDCCDGSDEPSGKCPNTCVEANDRAQREDVGRENARAEGNRRKAEILVESQAERQKLVRLLREKNQRLAALRYEIQRRSAVGECIREFTEGTKSRCLSVVRSVMDLTAVVRAILQDDSCIAWAPRENNTGECSFGCFDQVPSDIEGQCLCGDGMSYGIARGHMPTTCAFVCFFKQTFPIADYETDELQIESDETVTALESLEENSRQDYGPRDEFFSYRSFAVSKAVGEYVYTVGFFDRVTQRNRRDGSEVNCGEWKGFAASNYAAWGSSVDYATLKFADGDSSWSGAVRSTSVRLVCGPIEEIIGVLEGPPCVYTIAVKSPLACDASDDLPLVGEFDVVRKSNGEDPMRVDL
ncbi:protein kinase C substrate protein [Perkinsela sp. CCAP 1560/4]|nr:protein kinase C substrate protein [Perkinsela sp. CCAP 1560/4]|eukprot:KNH05568.1 protein kinase C substrate protein [Perkinsela sp. CCAP 1560/4]